MGYNTTYSLEVEPPILDKAFEDFFEPGAVFWMLEGRDPQVGYLGNGYCTWYEHEDEMKLLSKGFPNHLFTLWGEGDSSGDIWCKYFQDGKMQFCPPTIVYEKYDPEK